MNATSAEPPGAPGVLVVDDDTDLLRLVALRLGAAGYAVSTAESGERACELLIDAAPQVVVTDLRMPGMDGMALFEYIQDSHPGLPVIVLTAHGSIPDAVDATRSGVFAYLTKPFDGRHLLAEVQRAVRCGLSMPAGGDPAAWHRDIVTRSPLMTELLRRVAMVARGDASVLIEGASGTGKELLARAVHLASPRHGGAFVTVNCAAIPEPLLESELFGHVRGAFSGASRDRRGLLQAADGGTLFLDEIGDMPASLQVKLLRALQERRVRPIGAEHDVPVDLRVVSATHRDLRAEIEAGRFREDLYYRINVVALRLPTLAERREDIPLLVSHAVSRLAHKYDKRITGLAPEAIELLLGAAWPGNVRQLLNVVERAVALGTGPILPASLVAEAMQCEVTPLPSLDEARRAFEREYLERLLRAVEGNVSSGARLAGRNRTEFYRLLARHGLDPGRYKPQNRG